MLYVGTAGYSYKDWIGPFYPAGTKDINMLEYYALSFNFVEVNSSYYHMPRLQLFDSMSRKTPDGFKFAVKLFGGFTHERSAGKAEAEQFSYSIKPLVETGKLICLLAQFPYSFHFNEANCSYLAQLKAWFPEVEINVEFRNQNWIRKGVMDLLRRENLGFVCVDEPDIKGLVRKVAAVTSGVAYLRFHGRNASKWYGGEGSERYDYLYRRDELLEWVSKVRELETDSKLAVISFNNHPMGKAIENARIFRELYNNG